MIALSSYEWHTPSHHFCQSLDHLVIDSESFGARHVGAKKLLRRDPQSLDVRRERFCAKQTSRGPANLGVTD